MSAARQQAGTWISQYNARLICGSGLSQSGPDGYCAANRNSPNYNAQLTLESPNTGVTGPGTFSFFTQCADNLRLDYETFDYTKQSDGLKGYQEYMSWIKASLIAGKQATIGTIYKTGGDAQYDHIVTVVAVGTNHDVEDSTYYPDDVLYIDDHGTYSFKENGKIQWGGGPSVPSSHGCTPFIYSYYFDSLPYSRKDANKYGNSYSIILPSTTGTIETGAGGNGQDTVTIVGPKNYGNAIAGPKDESGETYPVTITIETPTYTNGVENPKDPIAFWNYENPYIGTTDRGMSCTNEGPSAWMDITLRVTVNGLTPGEQYLIYQFTFDLLNGVNRPLDVPTKDFNKNGRLMAKSVAFLYADPGSTSHQTTYFSTSDKIEIFRVVKSDIETVFLN